MKTAKFSEVVNLCGEPSIYLSWVNPGRDKTLKRALAEHRVMTLHQELHGGKKDFASVGLLKDRHAQVLVFPKSLRRFSERKVIAIDYSLIAKDQLSSEVVQSQRRETRTVAAKVPAEVARERESKISARKIKSPTVLKPAKTKTTLAVHAGPATPEKILAEVKRAVGELAAGKSVPAYARLKRLLESTPS